ncbi:four helix bundle protein [Desulfamplus magnetovallimortis]
MLDLSVHIENIASHFSRNHRYTLGSELRSMCHEALSLIVEANSTRERVPQLIKLRLLLERIKIHLIIAREVKAFNQKRSFLTATELVVNVSRQNEGWLKSVQSRPSKGR